MKIMQINSVCGIRSTGRICTDLADVLKEKGHQCAVAYGREAVPDMYKDISYKIGDGMGVKLHALAARLFDSAGLHSKKATRKLLDYIDSFSPDVIHLHNIHGYYINYTILFDYIKKKGIPVVWTLHDCWAFTGHCSHYSAIGCTRWKDGCEKCCQKGEYPKSLFLDLSKRNYNKKRKAFLGVPKMTIVTPSQWLAQEVKKSFLGEYRVEVIQNGVDLDAFRPSESNFRDKYSLGDKTVVLGVATSWNERKGLNRFIELSDNLDQRYKIFLVGLDSEGISRLPEGMLGITRTDSTKELAEIYTASDVCLSLSVEETMGLTVVEANACGTPAFVLNKTALPELISGTNGRVIDSFNAKDIARVICDTNFSKEFPPDACIEAAKQYEKRNKYEEYIRIYEETKQ